MFLKLNIQHSISNVQFSIINYPSFVIHSIVFTGHMLDAEDRETPRFPKENEQQAKENISKALQTIRAQHQSRIKGIAGAACGGDIIFHECCITLNIPSEIYLGLHEKEFIKSSVGFAGQDWIDRFKKLYHLLPVHQLKTAHASQKDKNFSVWEETNNRMLKDAFANGGLNMTLLALWNGESSDGPGGTKHMVMQAQKKHGNVIIIDPKNFTGK